MVVNLTVFIYEPLYWRVTADVVFVALLISHQSPAFQRNHRISRVVLRGNATSELEQPRWRRRKRENKKKHAIVLTDKQKKTWTCSAHFEKNSPCHCRWSNVVKLYRKGNTIFAATFKASSTRIWIILIRKFFFRDSKIFTSTRIRIQIELPVHTYPLSVNWQSDLRLLQKCYRQSSSVTVSLRKLSHQALFRFVFVSSVLHGKKLQNVEPLLALLKFTVMITRFNYTHVIRLETEVQKVKKCVTLRWAPSWIFTVTNWARSCDVTE